MRFFVNWRKWNNVLHRDIGYLAVGLTLIYSISGIAVNHVNEWNPNYNITKDTVAIASSADSSETNESLIAKLQNEFNIADTLKNSFRSAPLKIQLFFEKKTITADFEKRSAIVEVVSNKPILRESNFLHLNAPKKLWTYVADAFAVSLILLAITGMFMLKGKNGLSGRGKWFVITGFIIPVAFLIIYF